MKRILSMGTAILVVCLLFASDLCAREGDKEDGKRGEKSRDGGGRDRGGSDRGGSNQGKSGGSQNQFKKERGESNRPEEFKRPDQNDFRSKSNAGQQNKSKSPSKKFDSDDHDKGDNFRRDKDDVDRNKKGGKQNDHDHAKRHDDDNWKSWTKDGWRKDNWNAKYNTQHRQRQHGYWYGGLWYPPLIIAQRQPVVYLQPRQPAIVGQKWLGVTYEAYDGGGAYVTGIYEGSPAQQLGLEVGDVIVTIDGMDATDLPRTIQASDGDITLQVLRGRTGELAEAHVNIIR